ncbi:RNA polymerase sigma factor [Marinibactrum halimedae]|uniref:RNA polymerase sigma factor n=1 Tax=Marinibactrum halimedae TaxID=1444977 RepID=A0AA37T052_9GAMM|nr:RNA polymerase sigma factor [Marinibactrum halimedae]MCD9460655.1 RNA polymerase sigma factor [Marinibactrum halimedae]GLS24300.1 RNA polymerase sigma factor [Marinibactrum halimedae]
MDANDELVDLIARCTLRDQHSLKLLYDKVGGYLNAVIFKILKSDELSNEVLQEAFIQIWENASTYRPHKAKALTWMTSIARYRALDRLSVEKRHAKYLQENDEENDVLESAEGSHTDTPDFSLYASQLNHQIEQCLSKLSEKVQQSVKLAYLEGFSREEIAEKHNTNTNTVKSWLRRGSERLKTCLEGKIEMNR